MRRPGGSRRATSGGAGLALGAGATRSVAVSRRRAAIGLVIMFVSIVAAALAHVSLRLGVLRLGYQITDASRLRGELEEDNRRLRFARSSLRSPERIETRAQAELGMKRPDPASIRVVRIGAEALAKVVP